LEKIREKKGEPSNKRKNRMSKAWQKAFDKIVEQCGGQEEFKKYMRGEKNKFDSETFEEWNMRNSKL